MFRRGTPLARTVLVMLLMNVVFVLQLVAVAGLGLLLNPREVSEISSYVVIAALLSAGAYLALIAARPGALARRKTLAQLFQVGVGGHAYAFCARIPSMAWMFLGQIAMLHCFGIEVPLVAVLVYIPGIVLISGVPVSVQGIGPAQVAQVAMFARYAQGDTMTAEASVLAWGLGSSIGNAIVWFLIGVSCLLTQTGRATMAARQLPTEAS
jgi:hypothetical protein